MSLEALLLELRARRIVLISAGEVWPSPLYTCTIKRAVRKHRKVLAELLHSSSIEVCPSRDLHRPFWRYVGGRYVCGICSRIAV
jgi:hypothetical protein